MIEEAGVHDPGSQGRLMLGCNRKAVIQGLAHSIKDRLSHDQDPEMAIRLHVIGPITVICAIYTICRAYFYVEDYLSLRIQPAGVYVTVNRYVPFWGDG